MLLDFVLFYSPISEESQALYDFHQYLGEFIPDQLCYI